jgi:YidC/Oxa1 family membrane protein insertase
MEGNKRTLAMVAVAVGIAALYFIVNQIMAPEGETSDAATPEQTEAGADTGSGAADADASPGQALSAEERLERRVEGTITTDSYVATIDNLGGGVRHFALVGDPRFHDENGEPIDVISTNDALEQYEALRLDLGRIGIPADAVWDLEQVSERQVRLSWEGRGMRVVRMLSAGEGPFQIWSTTRITNTSNYARGTRLEMGVWHYVEREAESGGIISIGSRSPAISQGACVYGDDTERKDRSKLTEDGLHGYGAGDVHVAAVENVYFTMAMAPDGAPAARCSLRGEDFLADGEEHGTLFESRLLYPWLTLEPGAEQTYRTLAYIGPKEPDALRLAGHHLPAMVDLGFFSVIAQQLARLLGFIHQGVPNWGLAIILLTLLVRLTLFPLTNLSFNSMARMRLLKPEIDRINQLYADDSEKKGAAMMELYRKHKINPVSGCLPSLLQLPVWWALYTSLSTNIELYHMPFTLWWADLSSPDPYYVLPLALGGLMHLQQRLSPTTMDPAQAKMMMWFMPIMITVFMLFLPSGLCLYMLTNSALGIGQQKLNEYRIARQAPLAAAASDDANDDDSDDQGDDGDDADDSEDSDKPQKRRPRRKRRIRRGRA